MSLLTKSPISSPAEMIVQAKAAPDNAIRRKSVGSRLEKVQSLFYKKEEK
jgi:hypothetical protein